MHRPRHLRSLAIGAVIVLVLGACGTTAPSPAPSSAPPSPSAAPGSASPSAGASADLDEIYATINEQVREIRGLEEKQPVEPQLLSPEELGTVIGTSFDKDYPAELVAADELMYQGLGLLPQEADLEAVYVDLLESQVAGLYDPSTDGLYVVSKEGGVGAVEKVYYSHEYHHALQDQHFDLEAITKDLQDQSDRSLARQAAVEGDAYVLMTYWLQQHLTPDEIAAVMQQSSDPEAQAALDRVPQIVQAQIMFAALQGTTWVLTTQLRGGWPAVDAVFEQLPESTEQILHPEKYNDREAPIAVDLPDDLATRMGTGWSVARENTLGEHQMSIWLGLANATAATDAAAGWGGDRIAVLRGPNNAWAIAWQTAWDTAADAAEFEVTAATAIEDAGGPGAVLPGESGTTRWVVVSSNAATLGKVSNVLGLAG